ncbi:MAG TPA: hypothetical protein VFN37_13370 [Candidatus Baltobacteraceae bacterium]|nr:hypothetical protein [Candidatus Baltobacteraceae bacterium]
MNMINRAAASALAALLFAPLAAQTWVYKGKKSSAGLTVYEYLVTFSSGVKADVTMTLDQGGKIAGYDVSPA